MVSLLLLCPLFSFFSSVVLKVLTSLNSFHYVFSSTLCMCERCGWGTEPSVCIDSRFYSSSHRPWTFNHQHLGRQVCGRCLERNAKHVVRVRDPGDMPQSLFVTVALHDGTDDLRNRPPSLDTANSIVQVGVWTKHQQ